MRKSRVGEKYGKYTITSDGESVIFKSGQKKRLVDVLCDCGTPKKVFYSNLRKGATKSCGCLHANPIWSDKEATQQWFREYYLKNREKLLSRSIENGENRVVERREYNKKRRQSDPVRFQQEGKKWREENKEKKKETDKIYRVKNRETLNKKRFLRRKTDIQFRLSLSLRSRTRVAIKNNQKVGSAVRDLGCSIEDLKIHLENQFKNGMSWSNWTHKGWHIDHIVPLSAFDLTDREQFLSACHYTNLQPLWAHENFSKGGANKINYKHEN